MENLKIMKRCFSLSVVILLLGCVPNSRQGLLTNEDRIAFLTAHNNFRRDASKPFQGTVQPPAAYMKRVYWSSALEADALAWNARAAHEEYVERGHSEVQKSTEYLKMLNESKPPYVGQSTSSTVEDPERIVDNWYGETNLYSFKNTTCITEGGCIHYTQVMWADSKYIGCSIAEERGKDVFSACNYYPGGKVKGVSPYIEGGRCSLCSTLTEDGFTECEDGLCQPKDKCSPVKECEVVDTVNCLCKEAEYLKIVVRLATGDGLRLVPPSPLLLLLLLSVVSILLTSSLDIA